MNELTITDVTRIGAQRLCVAGETGGKTIRLDRPNPTDQWAEAIGGVPPGLVLRIDCWRSPWARAPHIEDGEWRRHSCKPARSLGEDELASRLRTKAFGSVRRAFGEPFFIGRKGNGAFKPERGDRSLATIEASAVTLSVSFGSPRVTFRDADDEWREVPLQDLAVRTHLATCESCQTDGERLLQSEFESSGALLRVGLTRIWAAEGGQPACWLQINHIFLTPSRRAHFL